MSIFKVTYLLTDGSSGKGTVIGPKGSSIEECKKVLNWAASNYEVKPDSYQIEVIPERMSKGFIHPLYALLPDGREALVTDWYL